jgi:hypothetical protein
MWSGSRINSAGPGSESQLVEAKAAWVTQPDPIPHTQERQDTNMCRQVLYNYTNNYEIIPSITYYNIQ